METLSITEVCRRTGLSARTLRFYEARQLLGSQRSAAGQRRYGAADLARLHQITALKAAGFTLTRIGELLGGRGIDLAAVIDAQLAHLDERRAGLDEATIVLRAARAALAAGRVPDLDSFCEIIKQGATTMTDEVQWKKVADRYFSGDEQARWNATMQDAPADFDPNAYNARWAELGGRIAAALPMDPASPAAQALLAEWGALLAPFNAVATPEMKAGTTKLYDRLGEWSGDVQAPFGAEVWSFIKAASAAKQTPAS